MFVRNVLSFGFANAFGQAMRLVQEFAVRALLPPEIMGLWNFVLVVRNFGMSLDLGISTAARRSIALFHGGRDAGHVATYTCMALYLQIIQQFVVAGGIIIYAIMIVGESQAERFPLYLSAAFLLLIAAPGSALLPVYQSTARYLELSKKLLIYWMIFAAALVLGAYVAEVPGLIVATAGAALFQAALLGIGLREQIHFSKISWNGAAAKDLVTVGVPFRVADYPLTLFQMLDILFVTSFGSIDMLAIYATARMVLTQLGQIPAWVANVIITRIFNQLGAGAKSRQSLGQEVYLYLRFYFLTVTPALTCGADIGMTLLTSSVLREYAEVLRALPVLLLALNFLPQATVIRNFWAADKRYARLLVSGLIGLFFLAAGLTWLKIYDHISLANVAVVYLSGNVAYFLVLCVWLGPELWRGSDFAFLMAALAISLLSSGLALEAGGGILRSGGSLALKEILGNAVAEIGIVLPSMIAGLVLTWRARRGRGSKGDSAVH